MVRLDLLPHTEYILECRSRMQGSKERKGNERIGKEKTGVEEGASFHRPGVLWSLFCSFLSSLLPTYCYLLFYGDSGAVSKVGGSRRAGVTKSAVPDLSRDPVITCVASIPGPAHDTISHYRL